MKKFFAILVSALMVFTMMTPVMADSRAVSDGASLIEAIDNSNGNTIVLENDIVLNQSVNIDNESSVVIDLNSHSISFETNKNFIIDGGSLTLTGTGQLKEKNPYYSPVMVYGSNQDEANYSVVNIGENVTIEGWAGVFIDHTDNHPDLAYGIVINVDGTLNSVRDTAGAGGHGVYINGNINNTEGNVPIINLNETSKVTSFGNGIYAAGYAKWNLKGDVEGLDALSIKSGTFVIDGGTYHSTGEFADPAPANGNGSENTGSAVSITTNSAYAGVLNITINGGEFVSDNSYALYEGIALKEGEPAAPESNAVISINGGDYKGANDKQSIKIDEAKDKRVISGGSFADDSALTYLADDSLTVAKVIDNNDDTTYAIGNDSIEEAITDATEVIITQGSINLDKVPDGIEVSNTGSGEVTVNGQEVTDEPVVTHTHEWVLDSTNFADDHSKADFLFVCSKDETHNQTLTDNELDVTRVEATTEEDGKVEYKASVVFEGKTYDATDTVTIAKLPVITSKDDQSFTLGSKGTLTFTSDADYDNFLKVLVDNKELAKENYTVKEGSTVVTLSNEYLNTLSAGTHELSIVSNNGTATTTFEIVKGADPEIVVPGTGINNTVMPVAIGSIILAFSAVSLVILKKRYSK